MNGQMTMEKREERLRVVSPLTNIIEKENEVVIEAEMVGVDRNEIEIELNENELTIAGKQNRNGIPEGFTSLYRERRAFEYRRAFELSAMIDKENINAGHENGVLKLTLPKTKKAEPRKIAVN